MLQSITPVRMAQARIKALDQTSVHRITSSQVVVDLQTAVKELVENALDAGATAVGRLLLAQYSQAHELQIDVRIKDNGIKSVEVIDNGCGIAKDDYDTVGGISHRRQYSKFDGIY